VRNTHPNSRESLRRLSNLTGLQMVIYLVYRQNRNPLTDRQVKEKLDVDDMNNVRPRITELINSRHLRECEDVKDEKTGRKVRTVTVAYDQGEQTTIW